MRKHAPLYLKLIQGSGEPMRLAIFAALVISAVQVAPAHSEFRGDVSLGPNPNDPSGRTKILLKDFGYLDPNGYGWEASKGNITDGASIPGIFHPIIGGNWTFEYIKAAIIHDHYCTRTVRPWRKTHRVFYDILRESGVFGPKAAAMYYAVLVGGPKWGQPMPGKPCRITEVCVRMTKENETIASRSAIYSDPAVQADVKDFEAQLDRSPQNLTPEDVEALAAERNPDDSFLNGTRDLPKSIMFEAE